MMVAELVVITVWESGMSVSGSIPLPAPPSIHSYTSGDEGGIVRARSSGKITAMQIRCCAQPLTVSSYSAASHCVQC